VYWNGRRREGGGRRRREEAWTSSMEPHLASLKRSLDDVVKLQNKDFLKAMICFRWEEVCTGRGEGRGKREKREEGRGKREEGRGKREEGRGKREEGRGKREEGRGNEGIFFLSDPIS
jgi:hypothetical protein